MKNYEIEVIPDARVIAVHVTPEYSIARDMPVSRVESKALLDAATEKHFYVLDITHLSVSLEEMIAASNLGARGKAVDMQVEDDTPLWHHPNIIENVVVSKSGIIKLAAKGLSSNAFGNLNIKVVETMEDALAYCREYFASH